MKVEIHNVYSDGHESREVIELPEPPAGTTVELLDLPIWQGNIPFQVLPPGDASHDNWWWDNVHPHTGDGHGEWKGEPHPRLQAGYFVKIVEAADPQLVGAKWEWC